MDVFSIATLGPKGSYADIASNIYGKRVGNYLIEFCPTVYDTLDGVRDGKYDVAVVPWYNSVDGIVGTHVDDIIEMNDFVKIKDEVVILIKHYLVANKKIGLNEIDSVYSHKSALEQCRKKLNRMLPNAKLIPTSSTSEAAKYVKNNGGKSAAICSYDAFKELQLELLSDDIQDYSNNETRFAICSLTDSTKPIGNDRTLIALKYGKDRAGLLHETLGYFTKNNINLYKVESRPYKVLPEEFIMIIGLEGHRTNEHVKEALTSIHEQALETKGWLRILGSYPKRERETIVNNFEK